MKCDIKIMASPKRYANVYNTCKILGLDMEKDVFFDDRYNGGDAAYTSRKTWELPFSDEVTHRCVLQDDVLLCNDFFNVIQKIVEKKPNAIISLFSPLKKMQKFEDGTFVLTKPAGVHGQGIVMPREHAQKIYPWGYANTPENKVPIHDDLMIAEYGYRNGIELYNIKPNIIQHTCASDSLIGLSNSRRVSKVFKMNVDEVNWDKCGKMTEPRLYNFYGGLCNAEET